MSEYYKGALTAFVFMPIEALLIWNIVYLPPNSILLKITVAIAILLPVTAFGVISLHQAK